MSRWECIVCGWVYDEAVGAPDDGIPAGTLWKDVPEDWLCPDCGVGKDDFELIEESTVESSGGTASSSLPVVIVGSGLAGYNLAKEFRKQDADTPLIIITADDGRNYSKPMLSTGYTKDKDADALAMADAGKMAQQFKASIWTFSQVTAINTDAHTLELSDAVTVKYKKLVLAWGADTIKPPLEGDALDKVFSINDLLDYDSFRKAIKSLDAKRVAIIGGGLIGCEFTNDLINGGFEVEAVDPLEYCLPTLLPEAAGKAVQNALEEKGAKFHFGALVTGVFNHADGGVEVKLNNGSSIHADLVVSAIGVRPRIELAKNSGIDVNRGIVVDKTLQTSAPDVYSLGDCAEVNGHVLYYVSPLMAGARALAKTLAGNTTSVSYPAMPVAIKTPACPVVVAPPARDAEGEWHIEQNGNSVMAEFKNANGDLLGFALTGDFVSEKMRLQKLLPPIFE